MKDTNSKIKTVLEKLLAEHLLGADNSEFIEFKMDALISPEIDARVISRVVEHLKDKGLIRDFNFWSEQEAVHEEEIDYDRYLISFTKGFRSKAAEYIAELSPGVEPNNGEVLLSFDGGKLCLGTDTKICYAMKKNSKRLKILTYLVDNQGEFLSTASITEQTGGEDLQLTRSEIGKIKAKISYHLKPLKGDEVIENEPDTGYRISPKYKIAKMS